MAISRTPAKLLTVLREAVAGATTASVALPLCVAAGVLAYSPLGADRAAEGAVVGIVSAIIGGSIASLLRRSSFVTTIPTNPNALIQATLLGGLLTAFNGNSALAMLVFAICATLAGLWQTVIGATGLARILKLAPYPVVAGFVSGVGFLIVLSQLPLFIPHAALNTLADIEINASLLSRLSFGALLVAGILLIVRWRPRIPALLAGLLVGTGLYHAMAILAPGVDLGPTIGAVDLAGWAPANLFEIGSLTAQMGNYDAWRILILGSFTLALVGTLDTVFALHAARKMADIEIDQNRDLVGQGIANAVTAGMGGLFVSTSLSLSSTNFQAGGRGRLSTLAIALVLLIGIVIAPQLIFALPRLVLAAILIVVGINVIDKWAIRMSVLALFGPDSSGRALARRSSVVVLAVAMATILGQPIVGGIVGVALSCVVFMIEMSRPLVRRQETIASLRSKRIRSAAQRRLLTEKGIEAAIFELQSALFFGNADELEMQIGRLPDHVNVVILDFRTVKNIDASGAVVLQQIQNRLARQDKRLFLSGLSDKQALQAGADIALNTFADLDDALEQAEEDIIARASGELGKSGLQPDIQLETSDFGLTMESEYLAILMSRMQSRVFAKGDVLCRAGDPSDRLWLLTKGSVSVWDTAAEIRHRIASIGPGCTVGEMGLLNAQPRSAEVCADGDVHAYELTADSLDWILENCPEVGRAVLSSIARQLAERLRFATQELRLKASD